MNNSSIRKSSDRGATQAGWLYGRHSFSFGDYYDPDHMGFRSLRVINEDIVKEGEGFPTHPHRDMEIITVVVSGAIEHKDSLGHTERLLPGEVQVMSAGSGIRHSEYNPLPDQPLHLLQIWIEPEEKRLPPSYAQKRFEDEARLNKLCRVAGRDKLESDGALKIHQDADVYVSALEAGKTIPLNLLAGQGYWLQLISGKLDVGGNLLDAGDAWALEAEEQGETTLTSRDGDNAQFILFRLGA